jgi:hypothetical protein
MPKHSYHHRFSNIELFIFRLASILFLILMLLRLFKAEISSLLL